MNMIDVQARYHRGDPAALEQLYRGIIELAKPTCWCLARQSKVSIDRARVDQLSHDAASRIIERYLRHKRYRIKSFVPVVRLEVIHAFTEGGHGERPTRKYLQRAEALSPDLEAKVNARTDGDPATYLQDLLDDHPKGAEIVITLVHSTTYPKAIRAVDQIVPRQWIYDHAVKLRYVWKLTRRRHEDERLYESRRGGGSRDEEAVQRVRADLQRRRERAAARLLRDRRGDN